MGGCEGQLLLNVGFVWEKERANVGVQENALRRGKAGEFVESSANIVVSYHCRRKEYELT